MVQQYSEAKGISAAWRGGVTGPTLGKLIITAYHSLQSLSVDAEAAAAAAAVVPSNEHHKRCTLSHLSQLPSPGCYCDAAIQKSYIAQLVTRRECLCTYSAASLL